MSKQMGIIKNAGYGCRDMGYPMLYFNVYISEGRASLQTLQGENADNFLKEYQVYDIHDLNGKPVWVNCDGVTMRDIEPCIIGGNQ